MVQLYLTDDFCCYARPERELRGFRRITLAPGESRELEFSIGREELAFPDADGHWVVEAGTFTLGVGGSQTPAHTGTLRVRV